MKKMVIMKVLLTVLIVMRCGWAAPLANERESKSCSMEYVTIWEDIEEEHVDKVVCETEFREQCQEIQEEVCRNEQVCDTEERMVCEDSVTTKCGPEKQLVNQTFVVNECSQVEKDICEYEWIGEGENRQWTPVDGSCVTKPVEECEDVTKYDEVIVEQEVCREIPIEDCHVETSQVCEADATREVCETLPKKTCQILPHEECKEIKEMVPGRISKRVAQLVCDEDNEIFEDDEEDNEILDYGKEDSEVVTIEQIFGTNFGGEEDITNVVNKNVNEEENFEGETENMLGTNLNENDNTTDLIENTISEGESFSEDTLTSTEVATESNINLETELTSAKEVSQTTEVLSTTTSTTTILETTSTTTTITKLPETTASTTVTPIIKETTVTTTSTTTESTTTALNTSEKDQSTSSESSNTDDSEVDTVKDGSRIVFSDDEINKRIEVLSTRQVFKETRTAKTTPKPDDVRIKDDSSQIFFPDK